MNKTIAAFASVAAFAGVAWAITHFLPAQRATGLHGSREEFEEQEHRGPPKGDYWALRVAWGGDSANLRFEPRWLLAAAEQDRRITSGIPAGNKSWRRSSQSPLELDPFAFTELGPKPLLGEGFGIGSNAGRVNAIVSDPDDPATAWLASNGGGVWKTTNCCTPATTWTVKTDIPEIASMAIGDLVMDPNDHDVLYAGTGDLRYGSFSFGAAGVLKSTDKGETWTLLGADVFNPFYGPSQGGFPQYQAIGKIVVDPNDSANVIVGTKTGVFFSGDAGISWTGPCHTNGFADGASAQRQDTTGLLALDQGGTTVLYVAIGTRGAPTPVQPDLGRNGANAVYRATMPAPGTCPALADWTLLADHWPAATGNGVAGATQIGRIELAAAPGDAQTLYAMVSSTNLGAGVLGIWKTVNGGDTWTQVGSNGSFPGGAGGQMWYDAGLSVSPTDPDTVFASTIDLFRSTNGGASFSNLTFAYSGGDVHPDNHARAFVDGDPNRLLNGTDGGVYYTANALAASPDWISLNDTLATIEVYHGDIGADFAVSPNPGATAGFQDNGSATVVFGGDPQAAAWNSTFGGDGIVSRIEPVLGQRWYYSSQNGNVVVSTNGPDDADTDASGNWFGDNLSFIFPFDIYRYGELDAPGSGCSSTNGCTHLVAGSTRVWETTTGGVNGSGWAPKTGNLTKGTLVLGGDDRSFINNLHYAVGDPSVAIVGTNDGNVQYVFGLGTSGTATAIDVTGGNQVLPNRPIMDVATDPLDPLVGYAAVAGFDANSPATPGHVFQVTCNAQCASFSWADKSGNLPDIPANAIIVNPHIPQQVFVGTDWGLYYTDDIGAAAPLWQRFESLPHVMIWSMSIDRGFTTLAVFTRSRGAWAWPLPESAGPDRADLAVSIDAPVQAARGTRFAYTINVRNEGPDAAGDVAVDSMLPRGLEFSHNGGDCTGPFPCGFADLAAGAARMITSTVCIPAGYSGSDPIPLEASVVAVTDDPDAADNQADATVAIDADAVFIDDFDPCT